MQPQSPNPQYEFIFKDQAQPKKSFGLPNLPSGVKITLGIVIGLFLVVILYVVLFSNKGGKSTPLMGVMGRAQEIARVSDMLQQQSKDEDTVNLAATAEISMSSDQAQLTSYLKKNHQKVNTSQLLVYKDTKTDSEVQAAAQNNTLESYYQSYLKKQLDSYHTALAEAYSTAGPNAKLILQKSNDSVETLLSLKQLKST